MFNSRVNNTKSACKREHARGRGCKKSGAKRNAARKRAASKYTSYRICTATCRERAVVVGSLDNGELSFGDSPGQSGCCRVSLAQKGKNTRRFATKLKLRPVRVNRRDTIRIPIGRAGAEEREVSLSIFHGKNEPFLRAFSSPPSVIAARGGGRGGGAREIL